MDFKLVIISPKGLYLETEISQLDILLKTGEIGVLANHTPLIAALDIGIATLHQRDKIFKLAIFGGIIDIREKEVHLIVEDVQKKEDIDQNRALKAKAKADEILNNKENIGKHKNAKIALKRALTRINLSSEED